MSDGREIEPVVLSDDFRKIGAYCARTTLENFPTDPNTTLVSLGLDDLDMVEMVMEWEEVQNVYIDEDLLEPLRHPNYGPLSKEATLGGLFKILSSVRQESSPK